MRNGNTHTALHAPDACAAARALRSITAGILIALGIGHALYNSGNWRLMIFLAVIPAGLQILGMCFVPESPRFLLRRGRRDEARAVLVRIRGSEAAGMGVIRNSSRFSDAELAEIEAVRQEEGRVTWREVFGKRYAGPMRAGIGLAVISALCGINAIMYCARPRAAAGAALLCAVL